MRISDWSSDVCSSDLLIAVLNQWAGYLYGPVLENRARAIADGGRGIEYGAGVAHKVHAELRRMGGVKPPREFVLMDRAAIGLGSVFMQDRKSTRLNSSH